MIHASEHELKCRRCKRYAELNQIEELHYSIRCCSCFVEIDLKFIYWSEGGQVQKGSRIPLAYLKKFFSRNGIGGLEILQTASCEVTPPIDPCNVFFRDGERRPAPY